MPVWVSLLRGVNLGPRNQVNMPALRKALEARGFEQVRTYVQSGNVVARSAHRSGRGVGATVRTIVQEEFGLDVPVVVRSPQQLRAVLEWCPFPQDAAARPTGLQVIHLTAEPEPARLAAVLAEDWSPDALVAR